MNNQPVPAPTTVPAAVPAALGLAVLLLLLPAIGSPSALLVQDTLKSALLCLGTLGTALFFLREAGPRAGVKVHVILLVPLVLALYAFASMLWSHAYLAAAEGIRWSMLALLMWLTMNIATPERLPAMLRALHWGACFASLWAALQFWFGWSLFEQGPQPGSTFYNKNFFAEYAVCVLPLSVLLLTTLRQPRQVLLVALSLGFNMGCILMTGTRSALLALCIVLALLCVLIISLRRQLAWQGTVRLRRVALTIALAFMVCVAIPTSNPKVQDGLTGSVAAGSGTAVLINSAWQRAWTRTQSLAAPTEFKTGSSTVRVALWRSTLRMIASAPWSGVGAGAWEVHVPLFQPEDTSVELDFFAHNDYLQLLAEYGLPVGGLVLALLLAYAIQATLLTRRLGVQADHQPSALQPAEIDASPSAQRLPRTLYLISLLGLALVCSAGFPLHLATTSALFAIVLGLLCASDASLPWAPELTREYALSARQRAMIIGVLWLALALGIYTTQRAVRAEYWLSSAVRHLHSLPKNNQPLDARQSADKTRWVEDLRRGDQLNPHYRKFTPIAIETLLPEQDWANAAWVLESAVASRPYVYGFWFNLASCYIQLKQTEKAQQALSHLQALRPRAAGTRIMEVLVANARGDQRQAEALIRQALDQPELPLDYQIPETAYALGLKLNHQDLVIHALEVRNRYWPQLAAEGYFRMGLAYSDIAPRNAAQAQQAFMNGALALPAEQRSAYKKQVPTPFRQNLPD